MNRPNSGLSYGRTLPEVDYTGLGALPLHASVMFVLIGYFTTLFHGRGQGFQHAECVG